MGDKADLAGMVFGLKETLPGDPCFDPLQPWFINFAIQNIGTAPAGTFSVRLETYEKGAGFALKGIAWATKIFKMPKEFGFVLGPQQVASADWRLPEGIAHTDFGSKNPFAFFIDPDHEVDESDETRANNVVLVTKAPPILPSSEKPPSPPSPWDVSASAVIGEKNVVVAKIKNQSKETLAASTLELVLHVPQPGAPTGKPEVAGTGKVPSLKPGAEALVSVAANRDFIIPDPGSVKTTKGVSKTGTNLKKANTLEPSNLGTGLKKQGRLGNLTVTRTTKFKVLLPFSLRIMGAGAELGFGSSSGGSVTGTIKIPGKK